MRETGAKRTVAKHARQSYNTVSFCQVLYDVKSLEHEPSILPMGAEYSGSDFCLQCQPSDFPAAGCLPDPGGVAPSVDLLGWSW